MIIIGETIDEQKLASLARPVIKYNPRSNSNGHVRYLLRGTWPGKETLRQKAACHAVTWPSLAIVSLQKG
jgi:hypothetical protein